MASKSSKAALESKLAELRAKSDEYMALIADSSDEVHAIPHYRMMFQSCERQIADLESQLASMPQEAEAPANKGFKLTAAQKTALEYLCRNGERQFSVKKAGMAVKPYERLYELGYAVKTSRTGRSVNQPLWIFAITPAGQAWEAVQFGSSEPVAPLPQAAPTVGDEAVSKRDVFTTKDGETVTLLGWTRYRPFAVVRYEDGSQFEINIFDLSDSSSAKHFLDSIPTYNPEAAQFAPVAGRTVSPLTTDASIPEPDPVGDEAVSSSAIPVADDEPIFLDTRGGKLITLHGKPFPQTIWTHRNPGGGNIVSGHNRGKKRTQSRKDSQNPRFKAHKVSFTMNGANIEKNTPKAQKWQEKHHLANRVAMPIPTITGAELLQQAGLTVLPKPKRLTRHLESGAA